MTNGLQLPQKVRIEGRDWKLFEVNYESKDRPGGATYKFYIYAINHEHACELLMDMKESAHVVGEAK